MFPVDATKAVVGRPGWSRREFLYSGAVLGAQLSPIRSRGATEAEAQPTSCILLNLVGGPSQLDTWDPKPDASEEIRGPFRAIETNVAGIRISELFPRFARVVDKVAIVRSVHHSVAAVHETSLQLMQSGRVSRDGFQQPHFGSVVARIQRANGDAAPYVVLPGPIDLMKRGEPIAQGGGFFGSHFDPDYLQDHSADREFSALRVPSPDRSTSRRYRSLLASTGGIEGVASNPSSALGETSVRPASALSRANVGDRFDLGLEPEWLRDRYGRTRFGRSCLQARRLIERGARFVTVNMYETVLDSASWDAHGAAPFSTLADYQKEVCPSFDNAYTTLLEDLSRLGLLETALVLALGEFGRTPKINRTGGRDHHPECWTALFAGGGVKGGQVVGASDAIGYAPADRPVTPAEIAATVYHCLGIDLDSELPSPGNATFRVVDAGIEPIRELL